MITENNDNNNRLFYDLAEKFPEGIWITDNNDRLVFFNHSMEKIAGIKAEEIVGRKVTDEKLTGSLEQIVQFYDEAKNCLKRVRYEARVIGREGQENILSGWCIPRTSGDEYDGIICTVRDITAHRRIEETLKEKNETLQLFIEHAPAAIAMFDRNMCYIAASRRWVDDYHLTKSDLIGKSHYEVFPEITSDIRDVHKRGLNGEVIKVDDALFERADGTGQWVSWEMWPWKTASGSVGGIVIFTEDITERKQVESAFKKSESQLNNALILGRMGHWELDVTKGIFTFSDAFYAIFKTDAKEMGGYTMPIEEYAKRFVHPDDAHMVALETRKAIETDDPNFSCYVEHRMLYADGSNGYIAVRFFVVKDENGKTVKTYGVNQDITERKRLEEEIQKSQRLESLGILAGGIAHDFNNLLGGIYGYIDLAAERINDKGVTRYLAKTLSTIDRARGLTEQLLTFSKGGVPIKKSHYMKSFIEETTRFALSGSNLSCRFEIPTDVWSCSIDKHQISQVIDNLVINAIQAMPEGGIIEIAAENITFAETEHPILKETNYVKIAVKDHGIGMPAEIHQKIFDPFYTTKQKGHGLGLTSCYSIVKRHGGCIEVESEPGKGSTLTFYLPAVPHGNAQSSDTFYPEYHGSGTFLVMDDDEAIRDIVGSMLESFGFSVIYTTNGRETLDVFTSGSVDTGKIVGCIFDLTIPGEMGGKKAVQEVRKINKDILIFVASGYADDPVMASPVEYGFNGSIRKPFRKMELAELLNEHINN